jgi:predicted MFS family arabinose efflux permease
MTLEDLGLNALRLTAGFAGGVVHALIFKQKEAGAVVGSILTGTLTANYLGDAAAHYIGTWIGAGGSAFVVGVTAMAICQQMITVVRRRIGNGSKEAPP